MTNHDDRGAAPPPRTAEAAAALDRAWRDASAEEPSAELDAAILAAAGASGAPIDTQDANVVTIAGARSAAAEQRSRTARTYMRWQSLAVAASVAGLAFVLVPALQREPRAPAPTSQDSGTVSSLSAPEVKRTTSAADAAADARLQEPALNSAPRAVGDDVPMHEVPLPAAPERVPVPASVATAESAAVSQRPPRNEQFEDRALDVQPAAKSVAAPSAPPPPEAPATANRGLAAQAPPAAAAPVANSTRERADAAERPDRDAWAARIAAMHAAGELEEAATSLRNFRATYDHADDYLPASLLDWARTVE